MKAKLKFLAAAAAVVAGVFTPAAHADEKGCTVMLCMANPNGWSAVQQCIPPVQDFMRGQMKKPKEPWPQCPEAGAGNYLAQSVKFYAGCPSGTRGLANGQQVAVLTSEQRRILRSTNQSTLHVTGPEVLTFETGVGDGSLNPDKLHAAGTSLRCVGQATGTVQYNDSSQEAGVIVSLPAYDRIVYVSPEKEPYKIQVYIDSKLFREEVLR